MKELNTIAFDIDGTLTDDHSHVEKLFFQFYQKKFGKKYNGKINHREYLYENIFPDAPKDFMKEFEDWYLPYNAANPLYRPYVSELTNTLHKLGVKVHIITARGTDEHDGDSITEITKESLNKAKIYYDELHIGFSDKVSIIKSTGCELIVEDSPNQIIELSEHIPVLVMDNPYNKLMSGANIWRITDSDFQPKNFVDKIKFVMSHIENSWDSEMDFTGDDLFTFKKNLIIANAKNVNKKNIIFTASAKEHPMPSEKLTDFIANHVKSPIIFHLNLLNDEKDTSNKSKARKEGDKILLEIWSKRKNNGINLANIKNPTQDTRNYINKVKAITDLLMYACAGKHSGNTFIFDGIEFMMVPRQSLDAYKDNPCFIYDCDEREFRIAKNNMRKKDYNAFLLFEDFTEISTQLRKWRIIAGTAKNELPTYINRQWCDSDGVDKVSLLDGEKAYNPELINSILDENTWLIADLHLSSKDPNKTKMIIRNIAKRVSKNDNLVILGDLDGKKGTGSFELTKSVLNKLPTKNIYLVLGNNDPYPISDYVKLGFKSVVDIAVYQPSSAQKVYLTHCPYPVSGDEINIHGHIHGSRIYWNLDWHNHYDIWDQDFYPIRIKDCLEKIEKNLYKAKSENHKRY